MPDPSNSSYLESLNEVQRQAVTTTDGPVLVVAGPGSGKTRVLTFRIAYIIEQGTAPWEILALTFTNKAAREMKERIEKVVGKRASYIWAGTFHSLFARILRVEAQHIGYPSNFTIYDTDDTKSLLGSIIREMNLDKQVYQANAIKNRISSAKSSLITPKLYERNEELLAQDKMANMPLVHKIYAAYVARCKQAGAMDFDDLLFRLYELLQNHPEVVQKYREKFKYVLVDEFQDTNTLQYAIIKRLVQYPNSPRNICVVGDDAQSIYAFRGATIQNILDFENDFGQHGIQTFKLEQNYRSTENIVNTANAVISYNKRQIQKEIWSDKGVGDKIRIIKAVDDNEEGRRVADTILEQKNRYHLQNSDIAILYRTNSQSRIFEEYLRRFNIAYRVYGGLSFYQRKEVKDLIAYLRMVVNPNDEEAFRRSINYPKRGIGGTSLAKVADLARQQNITLFEALKHVALPKRTRHAADGYIHIIEEAQAKVNTANAYELADLIAKGSGLTDLLRNDKSIEGMGRLENHEALLDGIKSFVEEDTVIDTDTLPDKSLATYLQNIALLTDFDSNEENQNGDVVTLMSVHAAKGLEYKSIFVVGLEEKLFPSWMSMDSTDGLDEERRLFYVAITRAELYLTLSYANTRYRYGKMVMNEPSRFLAEVPADAVESTSTNPRSADHEYDKVARQREHRARVTGVAPRTRRGTARFAEPRVDPATFQPSAPGEVEAGRKVLHLKFGEGKVLHVDGGSDNRIATIHFSDLPQPEKRIMLKFAKLQVLD
ncbi:DNA helicase-2/ATP-dependent DNA helicase PcrA [Lewinella marina]|uniref:DNA 3'-5' helicase n=1 Tax=Neolewinella marina TaxID=438751 RepID=A0A2G0CF18_9BACT|nr:UvrD-helicase domain-containing protein [Neolewinella marina]NJB85757.1 DNA helicase-2/ATP-dependent DNA helicase PcrA [Neolewinella marina]PHK98569.1 ATP-dependent DNA helicase [Neolewinella marina]